ncbi:hypothetical protein MRB53_037822 [Persea americana]|nr:hypothetical protein MRB53_037822 [Persea americana]
MSNISSSDSDYDLPSWRSSFSSQFTEHTSISVIGAAISVQKVCQFSKCKRYFCKSMAVDAQGRSLQLGQADMPQWPCLAPSAVLGSGLIEQLAHDLPLTNIHHDYTVHTYRDFGYSGCAPADESSDEEDQEQDYLQRRRRSPQWVSYATRSLSRQVYAHARKGRAVLTLGGDSNTAIGSIAGTTRACRERGAPGVGLIWIDSRPALLASASSSNDDVRNSAVAYLTGLKKCAANGPFSWLREESTEPIVRPSKVVYIGLRDIKPCEKRAMQEADMLSFDVKDVHSRILQTALRHLGPSTPIHYTLDLSALSHDAAPCTYTKVSAPCGDGLSLNDALDLSRGIHETGRLVGMDLVGLDIAEPQKGEEGSEEDMAAFETVMAGIECVRAGLGGWAAEEAIC